jgi:hypothetical protein
MTDKKQYCLKQPVTFEFDDVHNDKIVLSSASNGLFFMSPERFIADFEEVGDE